MKSVKNSLEVMKSVKNSLEDFEVYDKNNPKALPHIETPLYDAVSNQPWYSNTGVRSLWETVANRQSQMEKNLKESVK